MSFSALLLWPARSLCLYGIFAVAFASGCSIPNLDPPTCSEARTPVREFYSFHFGNTMAVDPEGLSARREFISGSLFEIASRATEGTDPFTTGTDDIPKAFRVGECTVIGPDRVAFQVLLFWRDDERSEQRSISVEAARVEGHWVIDKITR